MSDQLTDTNRQHEIDRLRLLLKKATGARKALMIEIEPATNGFRIIATGIDAEHEMEATKMVADYLNILMQGAVRFTVHALEEAWLKGASQDGEALKASVAALHGTPDAQPVPRDENPDAMEPAQATAASAAQE